MSIPNLQCSSSRDVALAIKDSCMRNYHPLPYNRFEMERSEHWWLSPTPEKVAFPYGKAVFTTDEKWVPAGQIFCGFNVEKGLTQAGSGNPNCVMEEHWLWNKFIKESVKSLNERMAQAHGKHGLEMCIMVACGLMVPNVDWAKVEFKMDGTNLRLDSHHHGEDGILDSLATVSDFSGFAEQLASIDGEPTQWQWIDLMVGSYFSLNGNGANDLETCAAMLTTFLPWMTDAGEMSE